MKKIEDLKDVTGGINAESVPNLKPGTLLVVKGTAGQKQALVEYLGEWNDPGAAYGLRLKVEIVKMLCSTRIGLVMYYNGDDSDLLLSVHEGETVWVSRHDLSMPEDA